MVDIISAKDLDSDPKYHDIGLVILESAQELTSLAETLGVPVIFRDGKKKFRFTHEGIKYIAWQ